MAEQAYELKKLAEIASDLELAPQLRLNAIEQLGKIGSREAMVALIDLGAKESLTPREREHALKEAIKIIRSKRQ